MATTTTNYGLKKPDGNDYYNIEDFNNNADIIDSALNTAKTHINNSALHISDITTASTTSIESPSDGDAITMIDSITMDGKGRVTARNIKTVTLPLILSKVLTGLSTATNVVISATDTILSAFGKLQAQITANLNSLTTHTSSNNNPHHVTLTQAASAGGTVPIANGGTGATTAAAALAALGITYSTIDLAAGSSALATGALYFVYE